MGQTNTNWYIVKEFEEQARQIDKKEHFRLKNYEVTVKEVAKVRYGNHCKYNINYHFVWIPKTRMNIMVEPFRSDIAENIQEICTKNEWHPLALEIMPDHIHFFVSAHPKWAPTKIIQKVKQETSKQLREKYSIIRDTRETDDFWATGYYCGTAGHVSAKQVARYILEQSERLKKNWNLFDLEPFEYDIEEVCDA
jgi:putative transposase